MEQPVELSLEGDKSITHRLLFLAALCSTPSKIYNPCKGKDIEATIGLLTSCGIQIEKTQDFLAITPSFLCTPTQTIDCLNSGTTMRIGTGFLAGQKIKASFSGDESLCKRPMKRVLEPLSDLGLLCTSSNGYAPFSIEPSKIKGGKIKTRIPSAQVKSALAFAALGAQSPLFIQESLKTRAHTETLMSFLGFPIEFQNQGFLVSPLGTRPSGFIIHTPKDPSTAAFFIALSLLCTDLSLKIKSLLYSDSRNAVFEVLKQAGAKIETTAESAFFPEPLVTMVSSHSEISAFHLDEKQIPSLIDEIPILAVIAAFSRGVSRFEGIGELRYKESDRIQAILFNLEKMGIVADCKQDILTIHGGNPKPLKVISTFKDHRIAMAFAIANLAMGHSLNMDDTDCVSVSSPGFFQIIKNLRGDL